MTLETTTSTANVKEPRYALCIYHPCGHCNSTGLYKKTTKLKYLDNLNKCPRCVNGFINESVYGREEILSRLKAIDNPAVDKIRETKKVRGFKLEGQGQ